MKAVIYARYSSDNQREESIEGQLRECKEYAQRNGILVLQSYIDRALSAKTDNRPEFQRMIRDSAKGLFDTVLVWKLDRFARNRYDSAHYKSQLKKNGVRVISATEQISDGPEGIILESMLEGMAEYYSAELAQKINRGLRENALKGKNNGGSIPLGYRLGEDHRLRIDPLTAPVVREIFQRYADGETVREIIEALNERHLLTRKGHEFRMNSFNRLLKNRKYIGEYRYKDVVIPDAIPAIVPKELFERVQERMKKNQRAPARAKAEEEYLLTTKLFCGHCGRMMIGESGKGRNGTIHRYYKCGAAKRRQGCHKKAVKKDWIEHIAVMYTIQRVFQDDLIAQIADELVALQNTEDNSLPLLRRQLADTERGIENMLNAIQQGIFTSSTRQRLEELEQLRDNVKASILQAELEHPQYSREDIIEWISRFRYGDPNDKAYQRQIIDIFLNSIYVFDDKLVFTYNYKNGSQTVSLSDVFAAFGSDSRSRTPPESIHRKMGAFLCLCGFAGGSGIRSRPFCSVKTKISGLSFFTMLRPVWSERGALPCLMLLNPAQNVFIIQRAVGHAKAQSDQVIVGVFHRHSVYVQEDKQRKGADTLVSVQEGMALGEGDSQLCRFLFDAGIKLLASKRGEGALHSGIKQTFIPKTVQPAGLLHQEPVKLKHFLRR